MIAFSDFLRHAVYAFVLLFFAPARLMPDDIDYFHAAFRHATPLSLPSLLIAPSTRIGW